MTVYIIAAVAENRVIGKNNDLVWSLPDDMRHFKEKTSGKTVITGRKNYESLPEKFRPLPKRRNIVVTRNADYEAEDAEVAHSLEEALEMAREDEEVYIIGGGQLYEQALEADLVDVMHITRVHAEVEGDTYFPDWEDGGKEWTLVFQLGHPKDDKHPYAFTFETHFRKR